MLGERIWSLFRPNGELSPNVAGVLAAPRFEHSLRQPRVPMEMERSSNGLRQFFENLPNESKLRILDLGGASQASVNFIALQGHTLYTEDLLVGLERFHAAAREPEQRVNPVPRFIGDNLHFPPAHFDGILVWDTLEFLDEDLLPAVVSQLQTILKPGGTLLTFFHTHAKGETVHICRYQIRDHQTLRLLPRLSRPLPRAFNNRSLERMFASFRSVKFFLAKDNLREVIVTR